MISIYFEHQLAASTKSNLLGILMSIEANRLIRTIGLVGTILIIYTAETVKS